MISNLLENDSKVNDIISVWIVSKSYLGILRYVLAVKKGSLQLQTFQVHGIQYFHFAKGVPISYNFKNWASNTIYQEENWTRGCNFRISPNAILILSQISWIIFEDLASKLHEESTDLRLPKLSFLDYAIMFFMIVC